MDAQMGGELLLVLLSNRGAQIVFTFVQERRYNVSRCLWGQNCIYDLRGKIIQLLSTGAQLVCTFIQKEENYCQSLSNWGMNSIKGKKRNCPDLMTREGQCVVVCLGNRKSSGGIVRTGQFQPGHGSQTCSTTGHGG